MMGHVRGESLATRLDCETVLDSDTVRTLLSQVAEAAPHEQLERLEAEIVLHEAESGDPETVQLLVNQRDALAQSRARIVLVAARRDEAAARLVSL